jgi:hypothetical protein
MLTEELEIPQHEPRTLFTARPRLSRDRLSTMLTAARSLARASVTYYLTFRLTPWDRRIPQFRRIAKETSSWPVITLLNGAITTG